MRKKILRTKTEDCESAESSEGMDVTVSDHGHGGDA